MGGEKQRVGELGTEMEDKVHLLIWRVEATDEIDVRTRVLQAAIAERERESWRQGVVLDIGEEGTILQRIRIAFWETTTS